MRIETIAQAIAGRVQGDGQLEIDRLVPPARAERDSDLVLAISSDAVAALAGSKAQAVVVAADKPAPNGSFRAVIAVDNPRQAMAKLTALFDGGPQHARGVHPSAVVAPDCVLGEDVTIGAYAVIGARSKIGARTTILSQATIGADVSIGTGGLIHAGVRIGDRTRLGERVIIHANAVIGSDGFSYAPDLTAPDAFTAGVIITKIHSLGDVAIGDDVEIGAATTIDRATLETTSIGKGTKIDNHVHIGHNVRIGESCVICGMVGISGSVTIGDRVRIGGGVGIGDHIRVGDEAVIAAGSGVGSNVSARTFVSGYPAVPHQRSLENLLFLGRQKRLHAKVDDISSRLDALEKSNRE